MLNKSDKTSPFKHSKAASQLNPSYLYDIDLIIQTKSWIKLELRNNQPIASKNNMFA